MKLLLKSMQIQTPSNAEPEVYSFKFDGKTDVHIFSTHPVLMEEASQQTIPALVKFINGPIQQ